MDVHLVDGTYELFRAYYGAPPATAPDGREVGATRGLARSFLSLIRNEGATHVAVAFDHTVESFRNELFDGYKTGEGIEPELWEQFEPAEEVTRALGMVVWPMVEFEADDALAAGAARYATERRVDRVLICSPDKDLAQCVVGRRVVCVDRRRRSVMDEAGVEQKFGVVNVDEVMILGCHGNHLRVGRKHGTGHRQDRHGNLSQPLAGGDVPQSNLVAPRTSQQQLAVGRALD